MTERKGPTSFLRPFGADLGPRVLSSIVLIPVTLLAVWLGGIAFALMVGVALAGVYHEWDTMVAARRPALLAHLLTAMVALSALAYPMAGTGAVALMMGLAGLLALVFGGKARFWRLAGLVYLGLVVVALVGLRGQGTDGIFAALFLGAAIWMTDIGAYFAGRQFGGAKLSPDISPSKTWSGAISGLAVGTLTAFAVWLAVPGSSSWWMGLGFAVLLSIVGQVGDLAESALKRYFRIKDSGDILPGHGGLMDRLDSLSLAAIALYAIGAGHAGLEAVAHGFLVWG